MLTPKPDPRASPREGDPSMLLPILMIASGCTFIDQDALDARMDLDGDGVPRPIDCDDGDDGVGAPTPAWIDVDGDGWGSEAQVLDCDPEGVAPRSGDCDDDDPAIFPGAEELCNEDDDDCDEQVDEGWTIPTWYLDGDGDGYGLADEAIEACEAPERYVDNDLDCDDQDETVHPDTPWYLDGDGDGYGDPEDAIPSCTELAGRVRNDLDCDDGDELIHPDATEICDEDDVDEDCDGLADDVDDSVAGVFDLFYADTDGDGLGDPAVTMDRCDASDDWSANGRDCDDGEVSIGDCGWLEVSAGLGQTCAVRGSGALECWGSDGIASEAPDGIFVDVDLEGRGVGACGLAADGSITCFTDFFLAGTYPGPYIDLCVGYGHFCALDTHGRLECQGSIGLGTPPTGEVFIDIDCNTDIGCALASDGTATCWGRSGGGEWVEESASGWVAMVVSDTHACGLTTSGDIECSGQDFFGSLTITGGPYRGLGAGTGNTFTIDTSDELRHWGYNFSGTSSVPSGRFESVDGGYTHACAVSETGELLCWGCQDGWDYGQCEVPDTEGS
jgi:hypothetical protein